MLMIYRDLPGLRFQALATTLYGDPATYAVTKLDYVDPNGATPTFAVGATTQQQTNAGTLIAGWDWSQAAQDTYTVAKARQDGVTYLTAPSIGPNNAFRGFVLALVDQLNVMINKINELVVFSNSKGATITQLNTITKANVVNAIQNKINAGSADS